MIRGCFSRCLKKAFEPIYMAKVTANLLRLSPIT